MLRPTQGLLGSSKAARRANLRAERLKALAHMLRGLRSMIAGLVGAVAGVVLLWVLPFIYLAAAYFTLDIPANWLAHRPAFGGWGVVLFIASATVCLVGIARAVQQVEPVVPVRPKFARVMLALSFVAALLMTIGDLAS